MSRVTTIIWDFDGTLADTLSRNLEITREIVRRLTGRPADEIEALRDVGRYGEAVHAAENWRQLYIDQFAIPLDRTIEAAGLWTALHHEDREPPELFAGVVEVVEALGDRRQGIVSQNGRDNIERALTAGALRSPFDLIVADEDLPFDRQKPQPDGLLQCAVGLHDDDAHPPPQIVLYVGDHPVDVECVRRASAAVGRQELGWRVYSVGAEYGDAAPHRWSNRPDFTARRPDDLIEIVNGFDR